MGAMCVDQSIGSWEGPKIIICDLYLYMRFMGPFPSKHHWWTFVVTEFVQTRGFIQYHSMPTSTKIIPSRTQPG